MALPIANYIINIVLKKIKKQTMKSDDYYLFNNYVVDHTNLYRIIFILSINYFVRNYYEIYIFSVIITTIIFVLIIGFIRFKLMNATQAKRFFLALPPQAKAGANDTIMLKSNSDLYLATVSGFLALAPVFQHGCNEGYMQYMMNNNHNRYVG
jgi:hypothetical protein